MSPNNSEKQETSSSSTDGSKADTSPKQAPETPVPPPSAYLEVQCFSENHDRHHVAEFGKGSDGE